MHVSVRRARTVGRAGEGTWGGGVRGGGGRGVRGGGGPVAYVPNLIYRLNLKIVQ